MARLGVAGLFLAAVVIIGIAGYHFLEEYTWLEAFYMTIITISTVGFREIRPLSSAGMIFTIGLLFAGLGVVLYTAVTVTAKIVEGEFQQFFGRKRMEKQIGALTDHYLVCGYGRIGEVVCRELASKPVPFVVIERKEERVRRVEEAGYLYLVGDATNEKVLLAAGVMKAKGLFATLPVDADNVFVILTAKDLHPPSLSWPGPRRSGVKGPSPTLEPIRSSRPMQWEGTAWLRRHCAPPWWISLNWPRTIKAWSCNLRRSSCRLALPARGLRCATPDCIRSQG
ncbi:potassium channel family protein [Candidatus Methylomirabilis sp.]|uniref:potassium channel family protein n=1 Tax=Candidatus Methylomirabilis sp. TaxID=2032687 RepID=UPI0030762098